VLKNLAAHDAIVDREFFNRVQRHGPAVPQGQVRRPLGVLARSDATAHG
jgi:hypothetical protein